MKYLAGTLVGIAIALALYVAHLDTKIARMEEHQKFLAHWVLIQKQRADQIECVLFDPYNRVKCDEVVE